jgi:peptide/nickel transport system substrate-binding protein
MLAALFVVLAPLHAREIKPLTIATGVMPAGKLNPHDTIAISRSWLYAALYDALTYMDRDGKLNPWLATSWENPAPTEWVFRLRNDAYFSNAQPVRAADVVKTVSYLTGDGKTEASAPFVANIKAATALDEHTVRITTMNPDPTLPQRLTLVRIATLPDNLPFTREALVNQAVGSGPYKVTAWAPNKATLTAAPKAWRRGPTPTLQAISLPDAAARKTAIVTGAADVTWAAFDFAELDAQSNANFVLEEDQIPAVVGMAFNTAKKTPFRDIRVRQAVISAVNTKGIVDALFAGLATQATQPARHEFLGFNPNIMPADYDPEKAKRLLTEAGYAKGFTFDLSLTAGGTIWDQVFQMVASDLRRVGITMNIQMQPEAVINAMIYNTGLKTEAMGAIFFSPSFDALDAVRQHTCAWSVPWFCDPEADKLRNAALGSGDLTRRTALAQSMMARINENAQALFMYESVNLVAYSKRIKNFRSDFGFLRYELMDVTE